MILADTKNVNVLRISDWIFGDGGDIVHEGDLLFVVDEEEARFFLSLEEAMEVLGGLDFVLDDGGVAVALNERFAPRARVEGHDLAPVQGGS